MASREQFLDDYEISRLICDSDDSEDDRHSDNDIALSGSEDEEDAVEEDLDGDNDSMYDFADNGEHGQPEYKDDEYSETGDECFSRQGLYLEQDTSHSCTHYFTLFLSGQRRAKCNNR
jgi:hypothetical protein